MFDGCVFFQFCLFGIFTRSTGATRTSVRRFRFHGTWRWMSDDFTTVNLFLMLAWTGCARPSISSRWLCQKGRLDTCHVKKALAPVAFHCILSAQKTTEKWSGEGGTKKNEAYGAHQSLQVSHKRILSIKSGTISFSATIYSYRSPRTSRTLSGTEHKKRYKSTK
jgi:hypothetical protein